ncbi:MAG: pesticidal protein Cry7Aa [bacterium]|nr:pesticidal protein Cry7Aa [bacterium]
MLDIKKEGIVLEITTLDFESEAVLNPAILQLNNDVHMFYRAVRKGNYSSIGYARFNGPLNIAERNETPVLSPISNAESHGIEDPRIVEIENMYYLSYTAYDGLNALGSYATSSDLRHFERKGILAPQLSYETFTRLAQCSGPLNQKYARFNENTNNHKYPTKTNLVWDKNLVFFPRKINNKFYFLHRIKPDIQIASIANLNELNNDFWENQILHLHDNILLSSVFDHESSYIGAGCPPIETEKGWLLIYHGVHDTANGYVYSACACLLSLEEPIHEIARLPYPLIKPALEWEINGEVNNVIFPTGTALFNETLYIYYGAADKCIACASVNIHELINTLIKYQSYDK